MEFQPGDTVRLKSSGPAMTVVKVEGSKVECTWFIGETLHTEEFEAVTLEKAEPPIVNRIGNMNEVEAEEEF